MKPIWSPETASKAYIDTIKSCGLHQESGVAELISAMAAGWNSKLIVETWGQGGPITTSIGLEIASQHTGGHHVCVVDNEESRLEYSRAMEAAGVYSPEVIIGEPAEEAMAELAIQFQGIDFLVVDCMRSDFTRVLRQAKLSHKGAVLVCKNANVKSPAAASFRWGSVLGCRCRVVRTAFLPVGKGLDIAYVAAAANGSGCGGVNLATAAAKGVKRRWHKHVDRNSGELHVIRT
ncbi:hypothetical protein Dimus_008875 [Dionaea muscipula]